MKILLDERGKVLFASSVIEYGVWDEPGVQKWKIGTNEYALDNNYTVAEVDELPFDFVSGRYFFVDGSFVANPNFADKRQIERKLDELAVASNERIAAIEDALCELSTLFG